uniref:Serine aminopeptidase S33 domain-containing protein n=1 Tax=Vitrella brassicaformis TaxID=1169539 RepID=A0A7S1KAG0_9ALVE|mmetsp:Transcript_45203/g.112282  ORF Transcript_45203/g.112282 Transcript_45203/m.112282 type:complete len:322 (+) Transcript_45203:75-1040(+)
MEHDFPFPYHSVVLKPSTEDASSDARDGGRPASKVVLLHGFNQCSECWTKTAEALRQRGHMVLLIDFLGWGSSARGATYRRCRLSTDLYVEQVRHAVLKVGWGDELLVMAGISLGGAVALKYVLKYDHVAAINLIAAAGRPEPHRTTPARVKGILSPFFAAWYLTKDTVDHLLEPVHMLLRATREPLLFFRRAHLISQTPDYLVPEEVFDLLPVRVKRLAYLYAEEDAWHGPDSFLSGFQHLRRLGHPAAGNLIVKGFNHSHVSMCLSIDDLLLHEEPIWHLPTDDDIERDRQEQPSTVSHHPSSDVLGDVVSPVGLRSRL